MIMTVTSQTRMTATARVYHGRSACVETREELAQLKRMRERQAKRVSDLAKAGQVVTNRKTKLANVKAEREKAETEDDAGETNF